MRNSLKTIGAVVLGILAGPASLAGLAASTPPESVYAPPSPVQEGEGINRGGVNLDLQLNYFTDYVFRGVDLSKVAGHKEGFNLQFDGKVSFDLGKYPHPFFGLFSNVYDSDPVSRFQEIRPFFGADLPLKPLTLSVGQNTYIYPEREEDNTAEVWGKIALDDSFIWHTDKPVLSPYILAVYDYDLNKGSYYEAGVKHDFLFEDIGLTVTPSADIGYFNGIQHVFVFESSKDIGFQHYDIGVTVKYSLNTLLNISRRFGEWTLNGYGFYTDSLSQHILGDRQYWGGAGIQFKY